MTEPQVGQDTPGSAGLGTPGSTPPRRGSGELIPLIDLSRWRDGDATARAELAAALDHALQESGFLLLGGHGVSARLRADVRAAARRFFALPAPLKAGYATAVGGRGWLAPGREANSFYGDTADPGRADLKESYTLGRDFRTGEPDTDEIWFAPNVWPAEVPELAALCAEYAEATRGVYAELLEMCAAALGLPSGWFVDRCRRSPHTFNINRYPPRTETGPPRDGQFRIAPHTDWGMLTILDRQAGQGGLQIQNAARDWVDAPFVADSYTINVGDLLSRWTGERWRSTRHRVLPPPDRAPGEELVSLVMFLEADVDAVVAPLPVGPRTDHSPVRYGDYLLARTRAADVATHGS